MKIFIINLNKGLKKQLSFIKKQNQLIMSNQTELAQQLQAVSAQIQKIGQESSATLQKVTDLETALANAGNVTPEVQAAFDDLKLQVQLVDDLVPDATETPSEA